MDTRSWKNKVFLCFFFKYPQFLVDVRLVPMNMGTKRSKQFEDILYSLVVSYHQTDKLNIRFGWFFSISLS